LGGLLLVPLSGSVVLGLTPGLAGGAALVWLLAAFLVGPRAALAIGLFLEAWLLAMGGVHSAWPSLLRHTDPFVDVRIWQNWARTSLTLLALTAVAIPAMVGQLRALRDAARASADLLAQAQLEEHRRSEANAARVRAEAELREAAGVDLLDLVGAGIAHRCGDLLQAIGTEVDLLRGRSVGVPSAARDAVDDMTDSVSAAAAVLRRLFPSDADSRPPPSLDLGELVASARRQLGKVRGVEIVVHVAPRPPAQVDPSLMHGVLLNLVLNARDAMPHGGTVTLTARPATAAEAGATGCACALDVADTGTGMDEATLGSLFQPFFTTKGATGTGIGLNAARQALEKSGGRIRVASAPGRGTTFTLLLPAAPEAPSHTRRIAPRTMSRSGAPILIVDDNAAVRRGWRRALADGEHVILEAASVDEALPLLRKHRIALAWMDVAMPGRSTRYLVDELRRCHPGAHRVVCSALVEDDFARRLPDASDVDVIAKPCPLSTFLDRVDRAAARYGPTSAGVSAQVA
jgi:signal transduction histidine kinase/CheY-like chemotaxis protein